MPLPPSPAPTSCQPIRRSVLLAASVRIAAMCAAAGLAVLTGCASDSSSAAAPRVQASAPDPAQLGGLPVVRIMTGWGGLGSGVPLSNDILITCRHCLPRGSGEVGSRGRIEVDGRRRTFELLSAGQSRDGKDDWAIIRIEPAGLPAAAVIDPSRRLREGEQVYICGYWPGDGRRLDRDELRLLEPQAICAEAVAVQGTRRLPSDVTIFAQVGPDDIFKGMSGGPAAVWDSKRQQMVVVGIYIGAAEFEKGQPEHEGRVQVIRRLPAEAIRQAIAPAPAPVEAATVTPK